jgi:hypothetical protein
MKKGFIGSMFDEGVLVMAVAFVLFTPFWIMFMIKNGFSFMITFFVVISYYHSIMITFVAVISYYHSISTYIKFNPEEYKKKKELKEWVDSLSLEELKKLKDGGLK